MSIEDSKKRILISQPAPTAGSPYTELVNKYGLDIDFIPFFKVEPVTLNDFRSQRVNILDYTAIVFSSRTAIDSFFNLAKKMRVTIPETMKYFCQSEAIALYLQKYIVYRKRKIFFGKGSSASLIDCIGTKHKNEKFLISCTDSLRSDVKAMFTNAKYNFGSAILVRTVCSDIKQDVDLSKYGMMVFYSPSDVKSLFKNFPEFTQKDLLLATYGKGTAKAAKDASLAIEIEAPTPESPSIAAALSNYFAK
ncbi:MAG: uroporphyrinogen-III synthase [Bacteroidales bacterium]|nr:uroporphyrinogen-III synthase [Bacteroidales bacterium]